MPKNNSQQQQPMPKGSSKSDQGDQKDKEKPQDSDDRMDKRRESAAELARRTNLIKDVWGHLPPALREKMLNIYSEKYLPRYEELVRRYFEALAEQGRQTRSR